MLKSAEIKEKTDQFSDIMESTYEFRLFDVAESPQIF